MKPLKTIFMLFIFVALVYFCTRNASPVTVDLLFTKFETRLYVMMLSALLAGAFLVGLTTFVEHARLKRQLRKLRKQHLQLQSKAKELEKLQEASAAESLTASQTAGKSN